jgi:hypothetical protein
MIMNLTGKAMEGRDRSLILNTVLEFFRKDGEKSLKI